MSPCPGEGRKQRAERQEVLRRCGATANLGPKGLMSPSPSPGFLSSCCVPWLGDGSEPPNRVFTAWFYGTEAQAASQAQLLSPSVPSRVNGQNPELNYMVLMHNGSFNSTRPFQVTLTCSLIILKFPFDTQMCNLSIASFLYPGTAAG